MTADRRANLSEMARLSEHLGLHDVAPVDNPLIRTDTDRLATLRTRILDLIDAYRLEPQTSTWRRIIRDLESLVGQ